MYNSIAPAKKYSENPQELPTQQEFLEENDTGEGERLSDIMTEKFQRYFDQWIRYWPKKHFIVKRAYDQPWFHALKKVKEGPRPYLPLYPALAIEHAEHHLDATTWMWWKQRQGYDRATDDSFWLGMSMPKKSTHAFLDIDTKPYLVQWHQPLQYHKAKQTAPRTPVMNLPLDHFKTLRKLYDHFPERIWAVSSATLGLYAVTTFTQPLDALWIHSQLKKQLAAVGLSQLEVHPMPGRSFRRPFGRDFVTITPEGPLTAWWEQLDYWEFDRRTPSFREISIVLLELMVRQWLTSGFQGDTRSIVDWLNGSEADPGPAWTPAVDSASHGLAAAGVPAAAVASSTPAGGSGQGDSILFPSPTCMSPTLKPKPGQKHDLDDYRHGNWVKKLQEVAVNGLDAGNLHFAFYELAKWLYWVELYGQDDAETEIVALLTTFAEQKHNGHSQRINEGNWQGVESDIVFAVKSAIKLDRNHESASKELFARIRLKRRQGLYREVICLAPLLAGGEEKASFSSPTCMSPTFDDKTELPVDLSRIIQQHAGRAKLMPFYQVLQLTLGLPRIGAGERETDVADVGHQQRQHQGQIHCHPGQCGRDSQGVCL
jgi:hypothetical protein